MPRSDKSSYIDKQKRKGGHAGGSDQSHATCSAAAKKGWEARRHAKG